MLLRVDVVEEQLLDALDVVPLDQDALDVRLETSDRVLEVLVLLFQVVVVLFLLFEHLLQLKAVQQCLYYHV